MENKYNPLILPAQLYAMPTYYQSKIFLFDATGHCTAQQHVNKMSGFFELHEIDEADVQMRLFSQNFTGDVKKWFKAFPTNHIADLTNFKGCLLISEKIKRIPYKSFQNMRILEEDLMKLFNITTLYSVIYITQSQLTLDPHLT